MEIPPKIRERLIVDYNQILPCPVCSTIPEPYNSDIDRPIAWYCCCRYEDDHEEYDDPVYDEWNHGAYGEASREQAIRLWNHSVYEWVHERMGK